MFLPTDAISECLRLLVARLSLFKSYAGLVQLGDCILVTNQQTRFFPNISQLMTAGYCKLQVHILASVSDVAALRL